MTRPVARPAQYLTEAAVEGLRRFDSRQLGLEIRKGIKAGEIQTDAFGFGLFLRRLLEHHELGGGELMQSKDPLEIRRGIACQAFAAEALTAHVLRDEDRKSVV